MKKFLMLLVSIFVLSSVSGCGYHIMKKKQAMMTEGFGTLMEDKLDLTEKQVKKLDKLTEGKMATMHEHGMTVIKKLMTLEPEDTDYAEKVDKLATESAKMVEADIRDFAITRAKIHAELTDEQVAKLREMRDEMGEKYKRWHKTEAAEE